ncbi:MAG: RES family NAD+ phosphorylase [Vulcanimicrobiaceae bacterium]
MYRLGREPDPWAPPDWAYAGEDGTFGNRFDDPRGTYRVLYASSTRLGCFLETLARFRVDVALQTALAEISGLDDYVPLGVVPSEWPRGRSLGTAEAAGVFAAIGSAQSLATLRATLGTVVVELGLEDFDAAAIRLSFPRAFTQAVSRYIYDGGRFDGVCYRSRYGDDLENWAVFEPFTAIRPQMSPGPVELYDPEFLAALAIHGLSVAEATAAD